MFHQVGEDGIQFCVELCANALESCLLCDVITKSLIYKTIAGLLPNDLEVCRACALLVFFLERTVEAYKTVYLLYMHPDQEYHVEHSPIRNHVRFETLQVEHLFNESSQRIVKVYEYFTCTEMVLGVVAWNLTIFFSVSLKVLKKDLYFDPEFWNLIALRTNCLKLMSEKGVSSALEEIMEDKWILNYCTKESALRSCITVCQKGGKGALQSEAKKRHQKEDRHPKEDTNIASKRLKVGLGKTRLNVDPTGKRRGNQGSRPLKDKSSVPPRRSFWQLDRLQDNWRYGEHRRITRLSEKNPPKRRIRTPKWLLEDSGTLGENKVPPKIKKQTLKPQKQHQSSVEKKSEVGQFKNNVTKENNSKQQKGFALDSLQPASPPQVILELSLPDNELMGTFIEDTYNRPRGFPQVLLYKPTVKLPATPQPVKTVHGKEVILRSRDPTMFIQQLHCYARRLKGKGNGSNIQSSVSTITRSSVQGSPPKGPPRKLCEKATADTKGGLTSCTAAEFTEFPVADKVHQAQTVKTGSRKTREHPESSAVKDSSGSQSEEAPKVPESPVLCLVPQDLSTEKVLQTKTSEHPETSAAEVKVVSTLQASATVDTEAPVLNKVWQAQTREHCEVSAVEMKVTIASQTPAASKVTQSSGLNKTPEAHSGKDASKSEVSQTSTIDSNHMVDNQEITPVSNRPNVAADSLASQSEEDISFKLAEEEVPFKNDGRARGTMVTTAGPDPNPLNDISDLTLVTEMVTELAPVTTAHKRPAPEDRISKETHHDSKPEALQKSRTTSSCSVPELGVSAVDMQGHDESMDDIFSEMPENSEPVESEESKLEYCCTFCNKVFKGSRVVAHAMFHYRKDECMFCGTMFKDDLLAMMHLSDHIEKLKKIKDSPGNKAQENSLPETKDTTTPKTSAKAKTINLSSEGRSRGRPRKSAVSPKPESLPDSTPSGSRKLRSDIKPLVVPSSKEKQNASKHVNSKTPGHKLNGHIGKNKELDRPRTDNFKSKAKQPRNQQETSRKRTSDGAENPKLQESQDIGMSRGSSCSSNDRRKEKGTLHDKTATKQDGKDVEDKNMEPHEKICCPVDGCAWFTDLSKNRVALLYHALEDHYGEVKPLELAFQISNSKCSICMRVLWSFDHFQHHVERHRLTPRHPCLHKGCTARFKTGMEMRRHTRRHSPLQAVCCLPGCSQLFICLWALNLHEREHYASKSTKPDKSSNKESRDKHKMPPGKKELDHKPKDKSDGIPNDESVCVKAIRNSRGQVSNNSSKETHFKPECNGHSGNKDFPVLKNLSRKDPSTRPTGPNRRLRQRLRKIQLNKNLAVLKSHKVISSSLLKHNIKVRHKFKNKPTKVNTKRPKTRRRQLKSKKTVHDENTTVQDNETVKLKRDQRSPAHLVSPPKSLKTSNVSTESEKRKSQQIQDAKTTEISAEQLKSKKSMNKPLKKICIKQKDISHNTSTLGNQSVSTSSGETQKFTAVKMKPLPKLKKRPPPKESGNDSPSEWPKKPKVANDEAEKDCPLREAESAESNCVVPQVEAQAAAATTTTEENGKDVEREVGNTKSTELLATPANGFNEMTVMPNTSEEKTPKVTSEVKSEKFTKNEERQEYDIDSSLEKNQNSTTKKANKTTVKQRRPCKDTSQAALKKAAKSGSANQQVEANATAESSPKDGPSNAALDSSASSSPAATASSINETTPPSAAPKEDGKKARKKEKQSLVMKSTGSKQANKKSRVKKEGEQKSTKTKRKNEGLPSVSKKPKMTNTEVQPLTEVKGEVLESSVGGEGKTSEDPVSLPGYSLVQNGQALTEEKKSTVCKDTLAEYGKKPYVRPPPTAYLDERYTTMPKRRKELLLFQLPQKSCEQEKVPMALQRQRCANCFATFNSAEDLGHHLQLQKCSNLFGFDSDDEGECVFFIIFFYFPSKLKQQLRLLYCQKEN